MHTENVVIMRGDINHIVDLASDIERWPIILPHYRWVTLLSGGGDRKTVEMAARQGRSPLRWRAIQEIRRDGATPVITYKHIWGVTKGMDVDWTFEQRPDDVVVRIRHDFSPPWPIVGAFASERVIGPRFVAPVANLTLATIKRIVETASGTASPVNAAAS